MGDYDIKNATLIVIIRILTYQLFGKNIRAENWYNV